MKATAAPKLFGYDKQISTEKIKNRLNDVYVTRSGVGLITSMQDPPETSQQK